MKLNEPVTVAKFVKRYKRFFADVYVGENLVTSLVPNTGSLKTCLFEGADCVISESPNPDRKLKTTLQFLKTPSGWVGVNTALPNGLVEEAWADGLIPEWREFKGCRMEFKISKETRLDMVLAPKAEDIPKSFESARPPLTFVEVKNVTMAENGIASFPDAVTTRGQKHLQELIKLKAQGFGAELVFVIQREGCTGFTPADAIDPDYGRLLREAHASGVMVRAFACDIDPQIGVAINPTPLEIKF